MKHTPGPWFADGTIVRAPKMRRQGQWIATTAEDGKGGALNEANARLIAAAPELLGALKRPLYEIRPEMLTPELDEACDEACAVVAKAEEA